MIGSAAVTVPSAVWLWQQGPKTGDDGHGHGDHKGHKGHEENEEKSKDESGEEGKDGGEEKPKDDAEAKSDEGDKGDSDDKDDSSSDSESDKPDTPATSDDEETPEGQVPKGKGEKVKGPTRPKSETKEEKDAKKDVTGASNPHLADPEESKKGEGIKDSAKIVGTVDPGRNIRKPGDPEHPEKMDKSEKGKPSNVNR